MKVIDCYEPRPTTVFAQVKAWDGRVLCPEGYELQTEHRLEVRVDGGGHEHDPLCMACTPDHLVELALGRLYADGVIDGAGDVRTLHLNCPGTVATVTLAERSPGCGGATASVWPQRPLLSGAEAFRNIEAAAGRFSADTPMHRRTHGAHSCFIAVDGHVVFECEDIGRHNAFDKAVGHALRCGIDLRRSVLFTSGRTPLDVIAKTVRAGIPVLASAAVPTDLAVRAAGESGVALVSRVRPGSCLVCSDPHGLFEGTLGALGTPFARDKREHGANNQGEGRFVPVVLDGNSTQVAPDRHHVGVVRDLQDLQGTPSQLKVINH